MNVHWFQADIRDDAYEWFLRWMLATQSTFSLVWRDQLGFKSSAAAIATDLHPFEEQSSRTMRWPGTRLMKGAGVATMIRYRCSEKAFGVLRRTGSIFSWVLPKFPEDLAFYDAHGECSFASVAHEREAWLLSQAAVEALDSLVRLEVDEVTEEVLGILRGTPS